MRPGFEVGYELNGKYYVNNHLMFKILVRSVAKWQQLCAALLPCNSQVG